MTFDLGRIGAGLPVAAVVPELDSAIGDAGVCVVQAPPGTGKTTLVPPLVANLVPGWVVVTQPRRLAARAAAARLASLTASRLGGAVGYVVRGDQAMSASTKVEFCTAGVMLRRLLSSPELDGVDAVIVDEVHERSLDSDLVTAMVAELRELRPELVLVVMSATLDADRWSRLLDNAPIVRAEADLYPLEIRWAPSPAPRLDARGVTPAFLDHLADQAVGVLGEGTVLVFAPGARECDQVAQRLQARGVTADALHGSLDPRTQDAIMRSEDLRRVIVATSIAESSLTVPGVRAVVDSGLSREPRYDAGRGMSGLVTVAEARSSAEQRAGRAARLGPGVAVRCFPESDWAGMRPFTAPEVLSADLTQAALDLAVWGAPGGVGLALPDPPPSAALAAALRVLQGLGAIDAEGRATDVGRQLARMPVEPRLGRALLESSPRVGSREAAEVIALLAGDQRIPGGDIVAAWRAFRRSPITRREADRLERLVNSASRPHELDDDELAAEVVGAAFPDRIARRRGTSDDYLLSSGTGAELPRDSRLRGQVWLAVAEVGRVGDRALVRSAAPLSEAAALRLGASLRTENTEATCVNGKVSARRVARLGAIELNTTPMAPTPEDGQAAVQRAMLEQGLRAIIPWPEDAEQFRRRLALLHHHLGAPWPAVDDQTLAERAQEWLGPELDDLAQGRAASRIDTTGALRRLLPWPQATRLDDLVPERLEVPTGSKIRLGYPEDPHDRVVLAVKLQELFGLLETPRIVDGRVPVLMHLLSPAQRPLAVTDDLASFWVNAYPGVRAENRGRYIKHPWPEDPLTAPPRRGTTRSGR